MYGERRSMAIVPLKPEAFVPLAPLSLVIGGARSGKSAFSEKMVAAHAVYARQQPIYLATAEASDAEMIERIHQHKDRRSSLWHTLEISIEIASALDTLPKGAPVLLDCLTLWLANILSAGMDSTAHTAQLLDALQKAHGPVVVVSNNIGSGTVPEHQITRAFRDHVGHLNQKTALLAECVVFMNAGLPLVLKAP